MKENSVSLKIKLTIGVIIACTDSHKEQDSL